MACEATLNPDRRLVISDSDIDDVAAGCMILLNGQRSGGDGCMLASSSSAA